MRRFLPVLLLAVTTAACATREPTPVQASLPVPDPGIAPSSPPVAQGIAEQDASVTPYPSGTVEAVPTPSLDASVEEAVREPAPPRERISAWDEPAPAPASRGRSDETRTVTTDGRRSTLPDVYGTNPGFEPDPDTRPTQTARRARR